MNNEPAWEKDRREGLSHDPFREVCPSPERPERRPGQVTVAGYDRPTKRYAREDHPLSTEAAVTDTETPEVKRTLNGDPVHHPAHYNSARFGIECITITRLMSFNVGNAFKYIWRFEDKNGMQDLAKAAVYLRWADEDGTPVWLDASSARTGRTLIAEHVVPVLFTLPSPYAVLLLASEGLYTTALDLLDPMISTNTYSTPRPQKDTAS